MWPEFQCCECELNAQITENGGHGLRVFFGLKWLKRCYSRLVYSWESESNSVCQGEGRSEHCNNERLGEGNVLQKPHLARALSSGAVRVDAEGAQRCTVVDIELVSLAFPKPALFWCKYFPVYCPGRVERHLRPNCWLESNLFY